MLKVYKILRIYAAKQKKNLTPFNYECYSIKIRKKFISCLTTLIY